MNGNGKSDGFTLMEMIVVLAIFALVMVAALPYASRSGERQEFIAFSQTLAAGLRQTQMEAIARNSETVFEIDLNRRVFVTEHGKRETPIPNIVGVSIYTANGELSNRSAGFRFFPDGGATGGRIVLSHAGEKRTIAVNWLTGYVANVAGEVQ